MKNSIVYVGSYSADSGEGIYTFDFNHENGQLSYIYKPVHVPNPSYLVLSRDRKYLYSVLENREHCGISGGGAAAYSINDDGSLEYINSCPSYGLDPCYIGINQDGSILAAANYSSGSISFFPIRKSGEIERCAFIKIHSGKGHDKLRQEMPHVHFTDFMPDQKHICAVDLGTDTIKFYSINDDKTDVKEDTNLEIKLRAGSGPRHAAIREKGRILYIINELSSEIAVFKYLNGKYELMQYLSTLPPQFNGENAAAAVCISPDDRFIYTSNRGHDSIAAYRICSDGLLCGCGIYSCRGSWPRDIAIDKSGSYMLAANQKSNNVSVLEIDKVSGALVPLDIYADINKPTCIKFLD